MQGTLIQPETGEDSVTTQLFSDATFNVSGRIAISLVGIVIVPLMLHHLGVAVYGVWLAALALASLCATVDLGMGWAVARDAAASAPGDVDTRIFLRSVLVGYTAIGVAGAALIALVGFFSRQKLHSAALSADAVQFVFLLAGIGFAGEWLFAYAHALLYGLRRFDLLNGLMTAVAVVRAAGIVILLAVFGAGLPAVAVWHACCSIASAIVGVSVAGTKARMFSGVGKWFSAGSVRSRLSFGVLSQLTAIAAAALWQAGPILLGYISSTSAVTSLGVGQRLPTAVSGVGYGLAETVFPAAAECQSSDDLEKSHSVLLNGTRWTMFPVLPACLLLVAIGPEILELWTGYRDPAASLVVRLTSLAILLESAGAAALHFLWGRGRSGLLFAIIAPTVLAAALAMYFFAPSGAPAIAVCMLAALTLSSGLQLWTATREVKLSLPRLAGWTLHGTLPASLCAAVVGFAILRLPWTAPLLVRVFAAASLAGLVWALAIVIAGLNPGEWEAMRETRAGRLLRRIYPLRAARNIWLEIRDNVRDSHSRNFAFFEQDFSRPDPYHYCEDPRQRLRYDRNLAFIAKYLSAKAPRSVCEVGCAEGAFTELLEPLCDSLLSLDFSAVALQRACSRRQWRPTTTFRRFDLFEGRLPGQRFDMLIAMHVVEFARRSQNREARRRLVEMVEPGGYLLLDSQRHLNDMENAAFRRFFYRGIWLNRMFAQHPELEVVEELADELDVITVYRRRSG